MLHMQAVHLCNGEYVIIIVIIHIPELKIIPSFSFIIKTWIQIAICLLKQVQVIHELMICIASTALTTMTKKIVKSSFKVVHSCILHNYATMLRKYHIHMLIKPIKLCIKILNIFKVITLLIFLVLNKLV